MRRFIWAGVLINPSLVAKYNVVSAAANNWQLKFIRSLIHNKIDVFCLSYMPDSYWPKGKLFPKIQSNELPAGINIISVLYFNIPIFREITLGISLIYAVLRKNIPFDLLITYNPFIRHILLGTFFKFFLSKKWVLVIADGDLKGSPDLSVYLSHNTFLKKSGNIKLFQGGISKFKGFNNNNNRIDNKNIVYTGNISNLTGIVEFAILFDQLSIINNIYTDIELHIYGKGDSILLKNLAMGNDKIKIFGFVDDYTLEKAMLNAWIFVNPRSLIEEYRQNTFPSKILEYIRFGKPILSTKSSGISSKYDDFLFYFDSENPQSLSEVIEKLVLMNNESRIQITKTAKSFCEINSWENVTQNFLQDLNKAF